MKITRPSLPRKTVVVNVNPKGIAGGEQRVDAKIEFVAVDQEGLQTRMIFFTKRRVQTNGFKVETCWHTLAT